jgi:hypothetical protein
MRLRVFICTRCGCGILTASAALPPNTLCPFDGNPRFDDAGTIMLERTRPQPHERG